MSAPDRIDRPADLPPLDGLARARANARRIADGLSGRVTYLLPDGVQTARGASGPTADLSWADVDALARAFLVWGLARDVGRLRRTRAAAVAGGGAGLRAGGRRRDAGDRRPRDGDRGVARAPARRTGGRAPARAREEVRGDGVVVVADLWRDEPGVGPIGGEKVGERWVVDGRVVLDVTRRAAVSLHGGVPVAWTVTDLDAPRAWLEARGRRPVTARVRDVGDRASRSRATEDNETAGVI